MAVVVEAEEVEETAVGHVDGDAPEYRAECDTRCSRGTRRRLEHWKSCIYTRENDSVSSLTTAYSLKLAASFLR